MNKGYSLIELIVSISLVFLIILTFSSFIIPVFKNIYAHGRYYQSNLQLNNIMQSVKKTIEQSSSVDVSDVNILKLIIDAKSVSYYVDKGFFIKKIKNKMKLNTEDLYFSSFSLKLENNLILLSYSVKISGKDLLVLDAVKIK